MTKGLFGIFSARHDIPLLLADVFHGERFGYPDFVLESYFKDSVKRVTFLSVRGFYRNISEIHSIDV
jgi:hypothetical protein